MPTRCTFVRQKMYYISELDFTEDGIQPDNFIMVNGAYLSDHYKMDFADRRSLAEEFSWLDLRFSRKGNGSPSKNKFKIKFPERTMIETSSVVVINTTTAKFKIELMANSSSLNHAENKYSSILVLNTEGAAIFKDASSGK